MVSRKMIWHRIRGAIKVMTFAMFMYTILTFSGPIMTQLIEKNQKSESKVQIQKINPLEGHWLKTAEDTTGRPKQVRKAETKVTEDKAKNINQTKVEVPKTIHSPYQKEPKDVEILHNNKMLNNTEVIFYWTEEAKLKAVTIMSLNETSKRGGVVAFPLYTKVNNEGTTTTLEEVFLTMGRDATTNLLEAELEIEVESYVNIDQKTFEKLSELMGPVDISGEVITVSDAFEQTRSGQRKDDTAVVRAVASRIIQPDMLIKIPKMVWMISKEIETNLGPSEIMTIYKITQNTEVETITKVALPGENYIENGVRYREVPEQVWKNILWELTK